MYNKSVTIHVRIHMQIYTRGYRKYDIVLADITVKVQEEHLTTRSLFHNL